MLDSAMGASAVSLMVAERRVSVANTEMKVSFLRWLRKWATFSPASRPS